MIIARLRQQQCTLGEADTLQRKQQRASFKFEAFEMSYLIIKESYFLSIWSEGDIILPIELCVVRSGETFKQWTARAKRCSIESTRQATGGTMRSVAERSGLTRRSLKSYLHRAKRIQRQSLFE
jgi:hypothetical protein